MKRHPTGVIPVLLNDVIFALHAVFACVITIIQCFIYEVKYYFSFKIIHKFQNAFCKFHSEEHNLSQNLPKVFYLVS